MEYKAKITLNDSQICALMQMDSCERHQLTDALIEYAAYGNYKKCIKRLFDGSNLQAMFILFADNVEPGNHKDPKEEEE